MQFLHDLALRYPEVEVGTACHNLAFKARKKSFLFMGRDDDEWNAKVKLADSIPEAETLAERHPDHYHIGGHGWIELTFPHDQSPPEDLLERWIDESFRLLAPKTLVNTLPDTGPPA